MKKRIFTAVLKREEDMYVAECPETGVFSQGKTIEDAVANLKEAVELYLEEFPLPEESTPIMTVFQITENAKVAKAVRT